MPKLLLTNLRLLTPFSMYDGYDVEITGSTISDIRRTQGKQPSEYDQIFDLEGKILCPGLIDIHTHGAAGVSYSHISGSIDAAAIYLARHGVTGFLPTPGQPPYEDLVQNTAALRELASINNPGAKILGLNFEGPYLNPKYGSRRNNVLLPDPDLYGKIIDEAGPLAKIMTVAPELEGAKELISYLNKRGIVVSVGHTEANEDELNFAVHHGARLATHMFCAMGQPTQEKGGIKPVGLEERLLSMNEVTAEIIADERAIHVAPFHLKNLLAIKGYERVILISDSIPMTGTDEKEYTSADGRTFIHDGDLRIVKSTGDVSGSLMTLDLGVVNMMKHTGIPLAHAITMASFNPARLLKLDHRKGSISVGMDADLMVIDENVKVCLTFVEGELAFDGLTA